MKFKRFTTGMNLHIRDDSKLASYIKPIIDIPYGQLFHVSMTLNLKKTPERFTLVVTYPCKRPQTFELPCSKKMNGVDWFGFLSSGEPDTVFYVDNLKIEAR